LRERCDKIRNATQRMTTLMDDFLVLDRLDRGIRGFKPDHWAPDNILAMVQADFVGQPIVWHQANLPGQIYCDASLLRVALGNLLSNALRHSPSGVAVRLSVCGQPGNKVKFSVADEGPGIAADELPRLFQKYFRGRASQTSPGAGLGLYFVERIVKLHGGSITVIYLPGVGCQFVIRL
jgi:signal transduction histidine kinase